MHDVYRIKFIGVIMLENLLLVSRQIRSNTEQSLIV